GDALPGPKGFGERPQTLEDSRRARPLQLNRRGGRKSLGVDVEGDLRECGARFLRVRKGRYLRNTAERVNRKPGVGGGQLDDGEASDGSRAIRIALQNS